MRISIAILLFVSVAQLRADDTMASAQQELKDQGFYYGQVTGEKNADTSAAIRRFQIRNGLQVTGELNDETLQSLRSAAASSPAPAPVPQASASPAQRSDPDSSDLRDQNAPPRAPANVAPPVQPFGAPSGPPTAPPPTIYPGKVVPWATGVFAETPYETAPPPVQRNVIITAQRILARQGLFKGPPDGFYGPDLEFSLRAYQSRIGLATTGRLDLETLGALGLLPGARPPIFVPRRIVPSTEPPVRGEWIRP